MIFVRYFFLLEQHLPKNENTIIDFLFVQQYAASQIQKSRTIIIFSYLVDQAQNFKHFTIILS